MYQFGLKIGWVWAIFSPAHLVTQLDTLPNGIFTQSDILVKTVLYDI
jgi:hypothetical protein